MDTQTLKKSIIDKTFDNFYIIAGDEPKVERIYIEKISEVSKKPLRFIDTISDIYGNTSSGLFSISYCYVCMDDDVFMTTEKAWDAVERSLGDNILILWLSNLDKRGKFYKRFSDRIYEFEPMHVEVLKKHISEQIQLSNENMDELIDMCGGDYGRCLLEIDKIKHYAEVDTDAGFRELVKCGVIYRQQIGNCAFEFADAVASGDLSNTFRLYECCIANGESVLGLLALLYNRFKMMLMVQSCNSQNIESVTGLNAWEIRMAKSLIGAYSVQELVYALKIIRNTEKGYKKGLIEEDFVMPFVLIKILT